MNLFLRGHSIQNFNLRTTKTAKNLEALKTFEQHVRIKA